MSEHRHGDSGGTLPTAMMSAEDKYELAQEAVDEHRVERDDAADTWLKAIAEFAVEGEEKGKDINERRSGELLSHPPSFNHQVILI
jgi:hypothetical protein